VGGWITKYLRLGSVLYARMHGPIESPLPPVANEKGTDGRRSTGASKCHVRSLGDQDLSILITAHTPEAKSANVTINTREIATVDDAPAETANCKAATPPALTVKGTIAARSMRYDRPQ